MKTLSSCRHYCDTKNTKRKSQTLNKSFPSDTRIRSSDNKTAIKITKRGEMGYLISHPSLLSKVGQKVTETRSTTSPHPTSGRSCRGQRSPVKVKGHRAKNRILGFSHRKKVVFFVGAQTRTHANAKTRTCCVI